MDDREADARPAPDAHVLGDHIDGDVGVGELATDFHDAVVVFDQGLCGKELAHHQPGRQRIAEGARVARHRGEATAEVTSAHPLGVEQVDELKHQLRLRLGREVSVELSVDPALLGGLVVRIGSQMIDSSIRTRLNGLTAAMKG